MTILPAGASPAPRPVQVRGRLALGTPRLMRRLIDSGGLALLCLAQCACAAPRYRITDLGSLGGGWIGVKAINGGGEVVGQARTAHGESHAFLWSHHKLRDLGTLGGGESTALGINDRGQVVGQADTERKDKRHNFVSHGVIWQHGRVRDLGPFQAEAINGRGDIAGWMAGRFRDGAWPAAEVVGLGLMRGGRTRLLRVFGPDYNQVASLNDRDDLIVNHGESGGEYTWIRRRGRFRRVCPPSCGDSRFSAINSLGQAAGRVNGDLFLWRDGRRTPLTQPAHPSYSLPLGLNDRGQAVGCDEDSVSFSASARRALLWSHGHVYDLARLIPRGSGWSLAEADAINGRGQVAGSGTFHGEKHAFLLTPVPPQSSLDQQARLGRHRLGHPDARRPHMTQRRSLFHRRGRSGGEAVTDEPNVDPWRRPNA